MNRSDWLKTNIFTEEIISFPEKMVRVKRFDRKSVKNRARVNKYRNAQKLRALHEKYILEQMYSEDNDGTADQSFEHGVHIADIDKADDITNKLRYWAAYHRITKTSLNSLLSIMKFSGLSFLPKDGRTLMRTPVNVPISALSKGKLWYNGIRTCLEIVFAEAPRGCLITLDFNFDGLPIAKSSNTQFWPILSSISGN